MIPIGAPVSRYTYIYGHGGAILVGLLEVNSIHKRSIAF